MVIRHYKSFFSLSFLPHIIFFTLIYDCRAVSVGDPAPKVVAGDEPSSAVAFVIPD